MGAKLRKLGLSSEKADAILSFLSQIIYSEDVIAPRYFDIAGAKKPWSQFGPLNAVHISNLNEKEALQNPKYISEVLKSALAFYSQRLSENGILDPEKTVIKKSQMQFCVRTTNPLVAAQLAALGARQQIKRNNTTWNQMADTVLSFFTLEQIQRLPSSDARLFEGYWNAYRLMSHPMQF